MGEVHLAAAILQIVHQKWCGWATKKICCNIHGLGRQIGLDGSHWCRSCWIWGILYCLSSWLLVHRRQAICAWAMGLAHQILTHLLWLLNITIQLRSSCSAAANLWNQILNQRCWAILLTTLVLHEILSQLGNLIHRWYLCCLVSLWCATVARQRADHLPKCLLDHTILTVVLGIRGLLVKRRIEDSFYVFWYIL